MQPSHLAPSVTPRPVKHGPGRQGQAPMAPPGSRGGRTYSPSASPIKSPVATVVARAPVGHHSSPFVEPPSPSSSSKALDGGARAPESTTPTPPADSPLRFRMKPLMLTGDIRNLDSNFDIAMSRVAVATTEVARVFRRYDIDISADDATTLVHEYEENNDRGLSYEAFVEDLVQLLRQTALNKSGTARLQAKKTRLALHCHKLSTMLSLVLDELHGLLRDRLRAPWAHVREAFRRADADKRGRLPRPEFERVCRDLELPMSGKLVQALVIRPDHVVGRAPGAGEIDYNEFLTHFGSSFQHGDTNSVGFSLIFARPADYDDAGGGITNSSGSGSGSGGTHGDGPPVSKTLQSPGVSHALNSKKKPVGSNGEGECCTTAATEAAGYRALAADPVYMEKLRIVLTEKVSARFSDVKKAFMAMDKNSNGVISSEEFAQVLASFNLVLSREEHAALLAYFDTNHDGSIDYVEFFDKFGEVMKPSAVAKMKKKHLLENSSLVFSGQRDIKGANKNRTALSSPGNELKEAFSRLPDELWRAIYVELEMSDAQKTGVVPSAELLRVLHKYLGDLPREHFASLFRACGSHVNELMNYRQLVKSYRQRVMDPVEYFHQDHHQQTERTYRKSPTESLVMVWSIRVQRAQMTPAEWAAVKEDIWRADGRRQGRILAKEFIPIVRTRMHLTEDQAAFLAYFYEDKNLSGDHVTIRYGSFLTDYEDSGLEVARPEDGSPRRRGQQQPRGEGKGRVRPPGYGIHNSHHHAPPAAAVGGGSGLPDGGDALLDEDKRLRGHFATHIRDLESQLQAADPDKRGFLGLEDFTALCRGLAAADGKWKDPSTARAFAALVTKYVAQNNVYYRGFLLDMDPSGGGLQTQALVVQEDDDEGGDKDGGPGADAGGDGTQELLDIYEAKDALRLHLTTSLPRQRAVYKLFQRMDAAKSGLLTYPELRRVLERLEIILDDAVAKELCGPYEEEDDTTGQRTGRVRYLMLLHAHGGRDPDKLDGMSDISSNCSYYSAISISPRAVLRGQQGPASSPRGLVSREHVAAAMAVSNAIEKPRQATSASGAAAAAAVERRSRLSSRPKGGQNGSSSPGPSSRSTASGGGVSRQRPSGRFSASLASTSTRKRSCGCS